MGKRRSKIQLYRDSDRKWRWRLIAANGRIVADSGESYHEKRAAIGAAYKLEKHVEGALVEV